MNDRRLAARALVSGQRIPVTSFVESIVVLDGAPDDLCQNPRDVVIRQRLGSCEDVLLLVVARRVSATAGELVPADGPALLSVVADPIAVTFEVDERIALEVRRAVAAGGKAVVEIGLSNEDGYPHKAALDAIDLRVERATGTIRFRATLANPKDVFGHGFFVRVRLTVQPGK